MHTRWALPDGFSQFPVQALVQAEDGYLWLGTNEGLWRFDGARFVQWRPNPGEEPLPSEDVRALARLRQGGLWIATTAGVRKLQAGRIVRAAGDEIPDVRALLDDPIPGRATLEASSNPHAPGRPDPSVTAITRALDGALWIGTRHGLSSFRPGDKAPATILTGVEIAALAAVPRGGLIVASTLPGYLHRLSNGHIERLPFPGGLGPPTALLADSSGSIWVGTYSQGLVRISGGQVERFSLREGLSGTTVNALIEDDEGGVWAGTNSGLDHFRSALVKRLSVADGLSEDLVSVVVTSQSGGIWVGTATAGIDRIEKDGTIHKNVIEGLPSNTITSLHEDVSGRLWAGTLNGLALIGGNRAREIRTAAGEKLDRVTVIAGDSKGHLWIADGRKGIHMFADGVVKRLSAAHLPAATDVYALLPDSGGRLWIAYYHGGVALLNGAAVTLFDGGPGMLAGPMLALCQDPSGAIWVGGASGLMRYRAGKWTTWTTDLGLPGVPVHEIIDDQQDGLWLVTGQGLVRLGLAELARQEDGHPAALQAEVYGASAGIHPQKQATWPKPRSAKNLEGRLWFATDQGVIVLDPANRRVRAKPPRAIIDQLKVDGRAATSSEASPGTLKGKDVEFEYTAIGLDSPESLRLKYRLEGLDDQWHQAGRSRTVHFTNLRPGRYRFQVAALSTEATWNEGTAAVEFVVAPSFHETWWFRTLMAAVVGALLFAAYRLRIKQITRRLEASAKERLAERTRIARELHDTLLQSIIGVSLQIDSLSNTTAPDLYREKIRGIRRQLSDTLREGRHSIWALRGAVVSGRNLADALQNLGKKLTANCGIRAELIAEGEAYDLPVDIEENLVRIAQGAITNAVLHSEGTVVEIRLIYQSESIRLRISDNGQGMDAETLEFGRPGHFGLTGMRERGERIGAGFSIDSAPGKGTSVTVTVPNPSRRRRSMFAIVRRWLNLGGVASKEKNALDDLT